MQGPLSFCKKQIVFTDRLLCVLCDQQFFNHGLIGKGITPVHVLGPNQIRQIIGHQAQHLVKGFRFCLAGAQGFFAPFVICDVT